MCYEFLHLLQHVYIVCKSYHIVLQHLEVFYNEHQSESCQK